MSINWNDTVDIAKRLLGQAKDGAQHAVSGAEGNLLGGIRAAASVLSAVRGVGLPAVLGLVGLARRRGPLGFIASFGTGFLVGTGVGLLLAPVSGAEARRAVLERARGQARKVEAAARSAEQSAEELVSQAKERLVSVESSVEQKVSEGLRAAKEAVESRARPVAGQDDEDGVDSPYDAESLIASADAFSQVERQGRKRRGDAATNGRTARNH